MLIIIIYVFSIIIEYQLPLCMLLIVHYERYNNDIVFKYFNNYTLREESVWEESFSFLRKKLCGW